MVNAPLSDIIQQRLAGEAQVRASSPSGMASLPSSYYNGSTLYAAGVGPVANASQNLQNATAKSGVLAGQVSDILDQRRQAAAIQQAAAAAKAAEAGTNAQIAQMGKQSYNIAWTRGLTNQQLSQYGLAGGSSTSYKVVDTGHFGNTSGASQRGALGGSRGSGTYKYVENSKLDASRNKVLALATSYLGTPYQLGGESHTSIDCSGLVQLVYGQMGYKIPMHSATWQKNNIPGIRTSFANLQPGDIVAWKDGSHIAIYAGNGQIIEAANEQRGTLVRPLWDDPSNVVGIHLTLPGEGA